MMMPHNIISALMECMGNSQIEDLCHVMKIPYFVGCSISSDYFGPSDLLIQTCVVTFIDYLTIDLYVYVHRPMNDFTQNSLLEFMSVKLKTSLQFFNYQFLSKHIYIL